MFSFLSAVMAPAKSTESNSKASHSQTGVEPTLVAGQATAADETGVTGVTGVTGATEVTATAAESQEHISQCGLEDDADEWEKDEPLKRIKTCMLSEELKTKFLGHLKLIFSHDTLEGSRIVFDPDDVLEVLMNVTPYLKSEPMLIEDVPMPITVVGDLHGQLYDLHRILVHNVKEGTPVWENGKFLFLGDYVDRGRQSTEIVIALFCMKMLYPDDIFLLRGNHEFTKVNVGYGFAEELRLRYIHETAKTLFRAINATFCYLSVAAIVGDRYFCAHGGISPRGFTRRQYRGMHKPYINSDDDVLIQNTLWSDPAKGLQGSAFNGERSTAIYFGLDELVHALQTMGCTNFIRAHQRLNEGYEELWGIGVSIFSAVDQSLSNKGSVACIDAAGKMSLRILEIDPGRHAHERLLRKYEKNHTSDNDPDPKTNFMGVAASCDNDGDGEIKKM